MRPIRVVLRWQLIVTAVLSLIASFIWGWDGALSAALGGGINVVAGAVYGWRVAQADAATAGEVLRTVFRAEGIKVLLIIVQLWLVLSLYKDVVHSAFFVVFVVTVGVFAAAIAVRDTEENNSPRAAGE